MRRVTIVVVGILILGCAAFERRPEACTSARGSVQTVDAQAVTFESEHCVNAGPAR